MSELLQVWNVIVLGAQPVSVGSCLFLLFCDIKHSGRGTECRRTLSRPTRWWYHNLLPVYPVASLVSFLGDGVGPLDPVWTLGTLIFWWMLRKHDHWDDEDRDAVSRSLWGRVTRVGNRLRVVAPAHGT